MERTFVYGTLARYLPKTGELCGLILFFATLCPCVAKAQFSVSARFQHGRVLQYESIVTTLRVANLTGRSLAVGDGKDVELYFEIETKPGYPVEKREGGQLHEPFALGPREVRSVVVDLLQAYSLHKTGPYTAQVHLRFGETTLAGAKQFLDVVPGFRLQEVKLPQDSGLSDAFDCTLRTLAREQREHLFLRVDDPRRNLCLGVYDLGPVIRYQEPQLKFDVRGHLHVLHQSGPSRYTHSVHTAEGDPENRTFHTKGSAFPRLAEAGDDSLRVVGALPYEGDISVQFPRLPEVQSFR